MANRKSVSHVYGVMEELRQLRDKNSMLSATNRQLAKTLNATKQDLVKARAAKSAIFSDKVVEWMEARYKPAEVRDQATQCCLQGDRIEVDHESLFCLDSNSLEPEPLHSPLRKDRVVRATSPIVNNVTCKQACLGSKNLQNRAPVVVQAFGTLEEDAMTSISEDQAISPINDNSGGGDQIQMQAQGSRPTGRPRKLQHMDHQEHGLKKRLRHRDADLSYVEPKLNTKLRRGDYYGLGKRSVPSNKTRRSPKQHMISSTRNGSPRFPAAFGGQCSPFRRRHVKRISYAEPKLNTKLRQGDKFTFTS